jgi:hypothetical protein
MLEGSHHSDLTPEQRELLRKAEAYEKYGMDFHPPLIEYAKALRQFAMTISDQNELTPV